MQQQEDMSDEQRTKPLLLANEENRAGGMSNAKKLIIIFVCALILAAAIIVAIVATKSSSSTNCNSSSQGENCFFKGTTRLPKVLKPLTYEVRLQPDLTSFMFNGSVVITVKCVEDTNRVVFHQKGLTFDKSSVSIQEQGKGSSNGQAKEIKIDDMRRDAEHEEVIIKTKGSLHKDKEYSIMIQFNGSLSDKLDGFYKSSYKTKSGQKRYLATTTFEPASARKAFPCFDEPAMKANFTIIIVHAIKYVALSNMPAQSSRILWNNLNETTFMQSVKMSTYLVAFVVCDFKSVENTTKNGVKIRIWTPPEMINMTALALESASVILDYYEEYFDIRYPLPKQDLIGIPDLGFQAMENWGLITYNLAYLLVDPGQSSSNDEQMVAIVISHELSHQWFGNLVTMKWWNDLWLNEGFASYLENVGVNKFQPKWKMMDQFVITNIQRSMRLDQLASSHPISAVVSNANEVFTLFDDISYQKGASLVNMVIHILGSDVFKRGLRTYLNKNAFGNAATDDLWDSLSQNTTVKVKEVMDTWILQMGFPLVTIQKQKDGEFLATQEHFLVNPNSKPALKSPYNYKWHIPLTYRTDNDDKMSAIYWMKMGDATIKVDISKDGWLKLNHQQNGFYRVNYPIENWKNIIKTLNTDHKKLSAADRAGLIDDAFTLAKAGKLSYSIALETSLYLHKEQEYVPWRAAFTGLAYIGERLATTPHYGVYQKYVLSQITPVLDGLTYEDKGQHLQKYLRDMMFSEAALYYYKPATVKAKTLFDDFMLNNTRVVPNFRDTVYSYGVRNGGEDEWEFMWKKYNTEIVASEKKKLLSSLTKSRMPRLLQRCLENSLNSSLIKSQDVNTVISDVAANHNGRLLVWKFFKVNWDVLQNRYGSDAYVFGLIIKTVTENFQSVIHYNEVKSFFDAKPDLGPTKTILQQSLESINTNIHWMKNYQNEVIQWLSDHLTTR